MEGSQTILEVSDLKAGYGDTEVLHGLSFSICQGEFLGVAGPNGAGKSTLLRILGGLLKPTCGSVCLGNRSLHDYPRRFLAQQIAVIYQDFSCPYDFTVHDIVAMGRSPFLARWKPLSAADREIVAHAMEMTEIVELRDRLYLELSGGEQQRVVIAKALAQKPSILLLDEPSTHLDLHHQVAVFEILQRLNREDGVTVFCITHDLTLASQYVDRFVLLKSGGLLADGPPKTVLQKSSVEELFQTPLSVGSLGETGTPYVYPIRIS